MNTYEPTSVKHIKQEVSEKLLRFIKMMTSTENNVEKLKTIEEIKVIEDKAAKDEVVEDEVAKAPINAMHGRLLSLFYKMYFISYESEPGEVYEKIGAEMNTNLGKRVIELSYSHAFNHITFDYSNLNSMDEPIFSLRVTPKKLTLRPYNISLSAHDIDMAIYEIEQIVEKDYKVTMNSLNKHHKKEKQLFCGNTK